MELYINDDSIKIIKPTETIYGKLMTYENLFYFDSSHSYWIFEDAHISNKYIFQRYVLGYVSPICDGGFPYCKTPEDVIRLLIAVLGYNNKRESIRVHISFSIGGEEAVIDKNNERVGIRRIHERTTFEKTNKYIE